MKQLFAFLACGAILMLGGFSAAHAQGLNEIGSATGINVNYTGSTLTLTGDSTGSYSSHNGSTTTGTYDNTVETFYSDATKTGTFTSLGGAPTSSAGENFGAGYFTITDGGATLLGGTFNDLTFNEFGPSTGDITLSNVDYYGTTFPTGYNPTSNSNTGSLTFNFPVGSGTSFATTDASTYYSVKSGPAAVPELSPVAILGIGSLALFGMLLVQGRSKRTSRAAL